MLVNSSPPGQYGRHFADDIFRCIFMNVKFCILIKISLEFVPKVPIVKNQALVWIMAWCRVGDKPLSEPMLTWFTDAYMRTSGRWAQLFYRFADSGCWTQHVTPYLINHCGHIWFTQVSCPPERMQLLFSRTYPYNPHNCRIQLDVIKWIQFPRYWPFVRGIHRWPVNSPHKGLWRDALRFSLICALNKRLRKTIVRLVIWDAIALIMTPF